MVLVTDGEMGGKRDRTQHRDNGQKTKKRNERKRERAGWWECIPISGKLVLLTGVRAERKEEGQKRRNWRQGKAEITKDENAYLLSDFA